MTFESVSFDPTQLEQAAEIAHNAADDVAPTLRNNFAACEYATKSSERDWVTEWDEWAEEKIKVQLSKFSREVGFMGEETGTCLTSSGVYWTIDAIDGTSHFVRGNELCTTMVALVDNGVPVIGVIYDFVKGESYSAISGSGAWRNLDEKLSVSQRPIDTAYLEIYSDENTERGQSLRKTIEATGAYLLRNATAGYTMLTVARGSTEGFVSVRNPFATEWDIAPGAILIHEAGGTVRNIGLDDFNLANFDFIAANQPTFDVLSELVQSN